MTLDDLLFNQDELLSRFMKIVRDSRPPITLKRASEESGISYGALYRLLNTPNVGMTMMVKQRMLKWIRDKEAEQ